MIHDPLTYIRQQYRVPAYLGVRVNTVNGGGVIVGGDNYLYVRLDSECRVNYYHPTWRMEYEIVTPAGPVTYRVGMEE